MVTALGAIIERRIIAAHLFEISEEESAVVPEWTTNRRAILRLREQVLGWRERVSRIEALVAEEAVQTAAPFVTPERVRPLTTPPEARPNSAMPPDVTT